VESRWVRLLRGSSTAVLAVVVAAFSHVAGGGAAPGVLGVGLALVFAVPLGVVLAGKTVSLVRLSIAVVFAQAAFHLLFSLGGGTAGVSATGGGHHDHAALMLSAEGTSGSAGMHHGSSMWLAHGVAAVVTVFGIWFGERAFWGLVELARTGVTGVVVAVALASATAPVVVRQHVAAVARLVPHDLGVARATQPRRGPPVLA